MINKIISILFRAPITYQINQWFWVGNFWPSVKELKNINPNESILDIACGTSNVAPYITGKYTGVDLNKNYIAYDQKKYPGNQYLVKSFQELANENQTFDYCLVSHFLHHLSDAEAQDLFKHVQKIAQKKLIIIEAVPQDKLLAKILYGLDQGHHFRDTENNLNLIKNYFNIDTYYHFYSPRHIYKHLAIICSPK